MSMASAAIWAMGWRTVVRLGDTQLAAAMSSNPTTERSPGMRREASELPWTCPGDALNTGVGLLVLAPGETRALRLEIVCG